MSRRPRGLVSSVSTSRPRGLGRHEGTRRRIWPRGLTKEHASVDVWLKDIARAHASGPGLAINRSAGVSFTSDTSRSSAPITRRSII